MRVSAQAYDFPAEDIDFVTGELRALLERRAFLTLGRFVEEFESAFAERHGARWGISTNSGTSALEAILRSLDVAPGEVVVPANTFAATAFAVVRAGARPVFADIGPDLALDPEDAAARLGPDTRAVITVHIGGLVSPGTPRLARLCRERGIALVEDAAHAHGSALSGQAAGTFGIAGAFSFFPTKVMTTGEGGMVTTSDAGIAERCRLLRDQAKVGNANLHTEIGANWRLTEVQALLGLAQLRRLDEFIARRQQVAARYDANLAAIDGLEPLQVPAGAHHNFYKYIARADGMEREQLEVELEERFDISLSGAVYDVPLHMQPAFQAYRQGAVPMAEDLCRRHLCLPIYPSLTDEQIDHVSGALQQLLATTRARREVR